MSTYTKAKSKRQLRHADSGCVSHKEDMRQAKARRATTFLPVSTAHQESKMQSFEEVGLLSSERMHYGGRAHPCTLAEQFANYVEREAKDRGWAYCERMKRGKKVTIRRVIETPIEILTVTAEPALNDYLWAQIRAGHDVSMPTKRIWARFLTLARQLLVGDRQRFLVGEAIHCDTAH